MHPDAGGGGVSHPPDPVRRPHQGEGDRAAPSPGAARQSQRGGLLALPRGGLRGLPPAQWELIHVRAPGTRQHSPGALRPDARRHRAQRRARTADRLPLLVRAGAADLHAPGRRPLDVLESQGFEHRAEPPGQRRLCRNAEQRGQEVERRRAAERREDLGRNDLGEEPHRQAVRPAEEGHQGEILWRRERRQARPPRRWIALGASGADEPGHGLAAGAELLHEGDLRRVRHAAPAPR